MILLLDHLNDITSHFSSFFSTCFETTAFRNLIITSTLPPTARLPSIKGNVSCRVQDVSNGDSFTTKNMKYVTKNSTATLHYVYIKNHFYQYL